MGSSRLNPSAMLPWRSPPIIPRTTSARIRTICIGSDFGNSRSHFVSNFSCGKPSMMVSPQNLGFGMGMTLGILSVPGYDSARAEDSEEAKAIAVIRGMKKMVVVFNKELLSWYLITLKLKETVDVGVCKKLGSPIIARKYTLLEELDPWSISDVYRENDKEKFYCSHYEWVISIRDKF
ncbi:hypothetical protein GIB67_019657 [Kingdonia uniflora]|uniref:Uncharacterized protein n=1 Tax=Kingdonia uniflora TaxID=39325 RepID=A0A7J7P4D2_9MAGN|nr:hypothetical protein GIB67_019657 [Kingdonia uniflora]